MIDRKVRIVGIVLLLSTAFAVWAATSVERANQAKVTAIEQAREPGKLTPAQRRNWEQSQAAAVDAARDEASSVPTQVMSWVTWGFVGLGLAMGLHLLVLGSAVWIERALLVMLVLSVLSSLLVIPTLLAAPTVALGVLVRLGIQYWCYTVVVDDLYNGSRRRRRDPEWVDEEAPTRAEPSYMRSADKPTPLPRPAPTTGVAVPAAIVGGPTPLLYLQGALDLSGFGGQLHSRGECDITLTPAPTPGAEVLAADRTGTWFPLGTTDSTGRLALQLPAGSWYLLVRSATGSGTPTIATVTGAPAKLPVDPAAGTSHAA